MAVAAELNFRRLFEGTPVPLLVLDPDLTIRQANDAYLTATLTRREQIVNRPLFDVFPDDPEEPGATGVGNLRASLHRVIDNLATDVMPIQKYAVPAPVADGGFEIRYWAPINAPVLDETGDLAWIVHRADDVTTYVRERLGDVAQDQVAAGLHLPEPAVQSGIAARQRLIEQNQALTAVLCSLDVAVLGCDREGRTVLANPAAQHLIRTVGDPAAAEQPPHLSMALFDTQGRQLGAGQHPISRALRGETVRDAEVRTYPDGHPSQALLAHGGPVTDAGRLAAVIALRDVTVQRRAERLKDCELQVSVILGKPEPAELVLANAVELIGTMLGWAGCEFWIIDRVSQVIRRQNHWQRDTTIGARLDGVGDLGKGEGLAGRAWQDEEPVWITDLGADALTAAQSNWTPLRAALAVPIASDTGVLGVLICYSDHHETPDDMRAAILTTISAHLGEFLERRRADQSSTALEHSRDEYIALVGHELRTPLTSIQANADMLHDEPGMPAEERQQMLEVVHRRVGELQDLVAGLLDVAGTRAGHIPLRIRRIDLAEVARDAAGTARDAPAAGIHVDAPSPVVVHADPDRVRDAVDELLRNARTWAPHDSTITVAVRGDRRTAAVTVSNIGPRIPADQHARVFDLFYRSDTLRHGGVPGAGLGLTRARTIAEQHRGTLTLSEPDGVSTAFTIRLPRGTDDGDGHL